MLFPSLHYAITLSQQDYLSYLRIVTREYPLYTTLDKDTLAILITSLLLYHRVVVVPEGKTFEDVSAPIRASL